MATKILSGSDALACDADVHIDPKLWFEPTAQGVPAKVRPKAPQMVVLHWTGAENPVETFYANCLARKVSAHFFVAGDGTIHQLADVLTTTTWHAHSDGGVVNTRSVGIEIQNAGLVTSKPSTAAKLLARPTYIDTVCDRTLKMLMFNRPQIDSVLSILDTLEFAGFVQRRIPREPLVGPPGVASNDWSDYASILRKPMTKAVIKKFRGVCGHYHVPGSGKFDPGTQLFQALIDDGWDH